jgi:hypothetical protein
VEPAGDQGERAATCEEVGMPSFFSELTAMPKVGSSTSLQSMPKLGSSTSLQSLLSSSRSRRPSTSFTFTSVQGLVHGEAVSPAFECLPSGLVRFAGAINPDGSVSSINGDFQRTDQKVSGQPVYTRVDKPSISLWCTSAEGVHRWMVGPSQHVGSSRMWAFTDQCDASFGNQDGGSQWMVYDYASKGWVAQKQISVTVVEEGSMMECDKELGEAILDQQLADAIEEQILEEGLEPMGDQHEEIRKSGAHEEAATRSVEGDHSQEVSAGRNEERSGSADAEKTREASEQPSMESLLEAPADTMAAEAATEVPKPREDKTKKADATRVIVGEILDRQPADKTEGGILEGGEVLETTGIKENEVSKNFVTSKEYRPTADPSIAFLPAWSFSRLPSVVTWTFRVFWSRPATNQHKNSTRRIPKVLSFSPENMGRETVRGSSPFVPPAGQGDSTEGSEHGQSRPSTVKSNNSRPSTTCIESELQELRAARENQGTPERPDTGFIGEEVRELMAARSTQHVQNVEIARLSEHAVSPTSMSKSKMWRTQVGRVSADRLKLEQDTKTLRKKLQALEEQMQVREHSLHQRRRKHQNSPDRLISRISETDSVRSIPASKQILPHIQKNTHDPTKSPQTAGEKCKSISVDDNFECDGGSSALEATSVAASSTEKSLVLLRETPLSVINKYWKKLRCEDIVRLLLLDEQALVETAIRTTARSIDRKKSEIEREAEQIAHENNHLARKMSKNPEMTARYSADAELKVVAFKELLESAQTEADRARTAYNIYYERKKWQDRLLPEEEVELAERRHKCKVADELLTEAQLVYKKKYDEAFVKSAEKDIVGMRRVQRQSALTQSEQQIESALEMGSLYYSDEEDPGAENLYLCNRLFAAVSLYALKAQLNYIPTMYAMNALCKSVPSQPHTASMNILGFAEYAGQWSGGKANGLGVETLHSDLGHGNAYEGQMFEDMRHGLGSLYLKEHHELYEGMWWRGKRHGFGIMNFLLHASHSPLPVAFVQYEDGNRISISRFDAKNDKHTCLLNSVRKIRSIARALARQARANDMFRNVVPEPIRRKSKRNSTGVQMSPTTNVQMQTQDMSTPSTLLDGQATDQIFNSSPSSTQMHCAGDNNRENHVQLEDDDTDDDSQKGSELRLRRIAEKKKKNRAKELLRKSNEVSVQYQRSELEKIDMQVEHAITELKQSTSKALSNFEADMKNAGFKTGRLYGLSDEEIRAKPPPEKPTPERILQYLDKSGVPVELAKRIKDVFFQQQKENANLTSEVKKRFEQEKHDILSYLANKSDWHVEEKGRIIIRKRYAGVRPRKMDDDENVADQSSKKDKWAHMPSKLMNMPEIRGVLDLMPSVRGAVLPSIPKASSSPQGPRHRAQGANTRPRALSHSPTSASEPPRVIVVPVDMPFDHAVIAFNLLEHEHILLLSGTYQISGTLEINKCVHILGEDGAKVVGRWKFKGEGAKSSARNILFEYQGKKQSSNFERLLHIDKGELLLQDCSVLCPNGYPLWADGRAIITIVGCVMAGSADGTVPARGTAVVMGTRLPLSRPWATSMPCVSLSLFVCPSTC